MAHIEYKWNDSRTVKAELKEGSRDGFGREEGEKKGTRVEEKKRDGSKERERDGQSWSGRDVENLLSKRLTLENETGMSITASLCHRQRHTGNQRSSANYWMVDQPLFRRSSAGATCAAGISAELPLSASRCALFPAVLVLAGGPHLIVTWATLIVDNGLKRLGSAIGISYIRYGHPFTTACAARGIGGARIIELLRSHYW